MSTMEMSSKNATQVATAGTVDMKLEVVVIPVSDVDRAKRFYGSLGWRLDADFPAGDAFRVVQFTPPGSPSSIHFGKGLTSAAPGSAREYLIVSDIEAARADLVERGAAVGRPTVEELRLDLRAVLQRCRPDWDIGSAEQRIAWERGEKAGFFPYGRTQAQMLAEQDS